MKPELKDGLIMRVPKKEEAEACAELFNDYFDFCIGERGYDKKRIISSWESPNFDLENDARIVVTNKGKWVGYNAVWNTKSPFVQNYQSFRIDPDYFHCGIGTTLSKWAEQKALSNIKKAPADAKVTFGTVIPNENKEASSFLNSHGLEEHRYFLRMSIDLENPPDKIAFPSGITVTTHAERQNLAEIIKCDDICFSDHWGYIKMTEEDILAEWNHWIKTNPFYNPELWFLALKNNEIIGLCLCDNGSHHDSNIGYIDTVCVKKEYRKQGIAGALLKHGFTGLYNYGKRKVTLDVDSDSLTGATRVYENAGMRADQRKIFYKKNLRDGKSYSKETL